MINKRFWKNKDVSDPSKENSIEFILVNGKNNDFQELEVKRASDVMPDWYKKIPMNFSFMGEKDLSIKACVPFLDSISTGYFLVTTQDYHFGINEDGSYFFKSEKLINKQGEKYISMHPGAQIDGMPIGQEFLDYIFKWNNPYLIKTPKNYGILFVSPINRTHLPFHSFSGFVDTDKFFMPVLFPFMMKNNFQGVIPKGTPVIQIIPVEMNEWKFIEKSDVPDHFIHKMNNIKNKYMGDRYSEGKVVGGIYKKFYRKIKKYI